MIVTKIQFYAIELARNREGHNDQIRHNFKPRKRAPKKVPGSSEKDGDTSFNHQLSTEVEKELQNILPRLRKTKWYEQWNDTDLLVFQFKNQKETKLAGTTIEK